MVQTEKNEIDKGRQRRGPILMVIGLVILIGVAANQIRDYRYEKALLATMEQLLVEENAQPAKKEMGESSPLAKTPSITLEGNGESEEIEKLIGKMKIECIDLEVPIVEGADKESLRAAVGHLPGTTLPGEGNCVIAGHRNYSFGRFFNRLNEVQLEDKIEIETIEGESYIYQVSDISIVEPDEVSILEPTKENRLTLITCTPIYIASHRLIVEAKLLE